MNNNTTEQKESLVEPKNNVKCGGKCTPSFQTTPELEETFRKYHEQPVQYLNTPMRNKQNVLDWAKDKNLLNPENVFKQFAKAVSEVGELGDALLVNDIPAITDGIGDAVVTLIILANQCGLDIEDCLESAYNEIKGRTGKTIEGTFIKD